MALAYEAIKSARRYLSDIEGMTWTDAILMPLLQEAHGELVLELERNGLPVILEQTSIILIPAKQTDLGIYQPTNIVEPLDVRERDVGGSSDSFVSMIRVAYLPNDQMTTTLGWWSWRQERVMFIGSTIPREVLLRFKGSITPPSLVTDPLGFIFAERFIGPRVAALAMTTLGDNQKKANGFDEIAQENLYKIVNSAVTNDQRPVRRRGYRSPKGFTLGPTSIIGPNVSGSSAPVQGGDVTWLLTTTPPDGFRTDFHFPNLPKWVSWNGINQFQDRGYTLTTIGLEYVITFIDLLGNVQSPGVFDDIREAY